MTDDKKIEILLKEYETLRTEILQRSGRRTAFVSLVGALGASAFFVENDFAAHQIIVLSVAAVFLLGVWWQLGNVMARCGTRVSEIEERVNAMAEDELLQWEHKERGSKLFRKFHLK